MIIKIKLADDVDEAHALGFIKNVMMSSRNEPGTVVGIFLKCHIDIDEKQKTFVVERVRPQLTPKKERPSA